MEPVLCLYCYMMYLVPAMVVMLIDQFLSTYFMIHIYVIYLCIVEWAGNENYPNEGFNYL